MIQVSTEFEYIEAHVLGWVYECLRLLVLIVCLSCHANTAVLNIIHCLQRISL